MVKGLFIYICIYNIHSLLRRKKGLLKVKGKICAAPATSYHCGCECVPPPPALLSQAFILLAAPFVSRRVLLPNKKKALTRGKIFFVCVGLFVWFYLQFRGTLGSFKG
jgi:hypothetical protein